MLVRNILALLDAVLLNTQLAFLCPRFKHISLALDYIGRDQPFRDHTVNLVVSL